MPCDTDGVTEVMMEHGSDVNHIDHKLSKLFSMLGHACMSISLPPPA